MAVTAFMLLLALASLSLAEDHVSAANGKDCPADSDCHSLSYYLSDPELYFTSNTKITFMEGTHLLDKEELIKISQVIDLLLLGIGQWVHGPEETIMESTAVIYCTKGSGGFAFYDSSRITITNLSLINCGALHSDKVLIENSTFLFSTISELNLHYISIQNSSGHGIIAYNCVLKLYSCSIAYSNIEKGSLDILQCNRQLMNGSNVLILHNMQPNETSWYFNIPQSHTMQFNNTDTLSSLSSDPIMVCFCSEIGFPNCSKRSLFHESMFPGEEAVTEIATIGNYGGTSSGTVSIVVHNATLVRPYGPQGTTALQCFKLLNSSNPTSASVAITVNGGLLNRRAARTSRECLQSVELP